MKISKYKAFLMASFLVGLLAMAPLSYAKNNSGSADATAKKNTKIAQVEAQIAKKQTTIAQKSQGKGPVVALSKAQAKLAALKAKAASAADSTVISGLTVTSDSDTGATVTWHTDKNSSSMIWYGTETPVDTTGAPTKTVDESVMNHSLDLTGLTPNTKYYVVVGSKINDEQSLSDETSFTTTNNGDGDNNNDNNAPTIVSVEGDTEIAVGDTENVTVKASDPANGTLSYAVDWGDMSAMSKKTATPFVQTATFNHIYEAAGTYTAKFTVKNEAGLEDSKTLIIHVTDGNTNNQKPVIATHEDITVNATSSAGATVTYTSPSVTDDVDVGKTATCTPASGTVFPVGTTKVTCSYTDSSGLKADDTYFNVIVKSDSNPSTSKMPNISGISAPTVLDVDEVGTWTVKASDAANGTLSYAVDWGDMSAMSTMEATPVFVQTSTFTHAYDKAGTYTIKFTVKNEAGKTNTSTVTVRVDEETPTGDTTAPVITNVLSTATATTAKITWTTDEASDSKVFYSTTTPVDINSSSVLSVSDGAMVTAHTINLASLTANTTYYFVVQSKDSAGNKGTSTEYSFKTNTSTTTLKMPNITGLSAPTVLDVAEVGTWKVLASDPANGTLSYAVDWGDGEYDNAQSAKSTSFTQTSTFTHAYDKAGTYTAKFTVSNASGKDAVTTVTVNITSDTQY